MNEFLKCTVERLYSGRSGRYTVRRRLSIMLELSHHVVGGIACSKLEDIQLLGGITY